jgi:hypothetical protein
VPAAQFPPEPPDDRTAQESTDAWMRDAPPGPDDAPDAPG